MALLKRENLCLLDLLCADGEENKMAGQELLKLITVCVCQEQHYFLNFYTPNPTTTVTRPWTRVIQIIADILKFSDSQHFYNLGTENVHKNYYLLGVFFKSHEATLMFQPIWIFCFCVWFT